MLKVHRNGSTFVSTLGSWLHRIAVDGACGFPPARRAASAAVGNAHTGETFDGAYRDDQGPIEGVIGELCIFFRDHHSGQKTQMEVGVIDFLADVLDAVGETKATILSAYRSAETNAMLARTPPLALPSTASILWAARSTFASNRGFPMR
jgi:uncharacterized protein YcbK (DUF882 family)